MVLWSANSSHYFPILTAGKSKIDLKVPPPVCSFTASSFHFLLPPLSLFACIWSPSSNLRSPSWIPLLVPSSVLIIFCTPSVACSLVHRPTLSHSAPSSPVSLLLSTQLPLSSSIPWLPDLIYHRGDSVSQTSATSERGVGGMMSERVGIRAQVAPSKTFSFWRLRVCHWGCLRACVTF